jgi:hypothetical protein
MFSIFWEFPTFLSSDPTLILWPNSYAAHRSTGHTEALLIDEESLSGPAVLEPGSQTWSIENVHDGLIHDMYRDLYYFLSWIFRFNILYMMV